MKVKPIAVDLYSGAGGLSEGLKASGFDIAAAIDFNHAAALTYQANHKDTKFIEADITQLEVRNFLKNTGLTCSDINLIAGGPPCQGFSMANGRTRSKDNPKNKLVYHFVRFVKEIQPPIFMMENVLGFTSIDKGNFLRELREIFIEMGYRINVVTLNAADYGVPQKRCRVFLIGAKNGSEFKEPKKTHGPEIFRPYITVREAIIGDLPAIDEAPGYKICDYLGKPMSKYQQKIRSKAKKVYNHIITKNSKAVRERKSFVPPGGNWEDLPPEYCKIKVVLSCVYKRLDPNQPSVTVSNYRKSMIIHPIEHRGLSVREAARIQSFRDNYKFLSSISPMQQQVGDAVPPLLAQKVGKRLLDMIN
jgi:DNA (cytosine-5)-methyltransferase 1